MEHYLETNDVFTFIKSVEHNGHIYEIYLDDYGQSYFIGYKDVITNEIEEICCGTYCDYEDTLEYIIEKQERKLKNVQSKEN